MALKVFSAGNNKFVKRGGIADETFKILSKSKNLKNTKSEMLTHINIGAMEELTFLTPNTKVVFNHSRQMFIEAPIL